MKQVGIVDPSCHTFLSQRTYALLAGESFFVESDNRAENLNDARAKCREYNSDWDLGTIDIQAVSTRETTGSGF